MSAGGEVRWPPLGRSRWPLTKPCTQVRRGLRVQIHGRRRVAQADQLRREARSLRLQRTDRPGAPRTKHHPSRPPCPNGDEEGWINPDWVMPTKFALLHGPAGLAHGRRHNHEVGLIPVVPTSA
jgi:hypothetical protein